MSDVDVFDSSWPQTTAGDRVLVCDGPLTGDHGTVVGHLLENWDSVVVRCRDGHLRTFARRFLRVTHPVSR